MNALQRVADSRCRLVEGALYVVEHGLKQLAGGAVRGAASGGELNPV